MSAIRAASAFVELSLRQSAFAKGLRNAERSLAQTGAKIRGLGQAVFAIGGSGIAAFTAAALGASDLNEAISKTENVFGEASKAVSDFAKTSATSFGISKKAANGYASELGLILLKTGSTQEEAANLSVSMVQLAADIASMNNISIDEALIKLKAGLVGSSEPLRSVGVLLSAAAVEARAAELGLEKVGGKFTEGAKVAARYSLIMEQTQESQGDFARTSDQLANTQRRIVARLTDVADTIGTAILPIYERVALTFDSMIAPIQAFVANNQELIRNLFLGVAAVTAIGGVLIAVGSAFGLASFVVGGLSAAMGFLASVIATATTVFGVVGSVIGAIASPIGLVVAGVGILIGAFLTMTSAGQAVVSWFTSNFNKMFEVVSDTLGGIFEALKAGDLGLAAEIGFTGVKLAIGIILEEIESLFGVSFASMFSVIAQFGKSIATVLAQLNVARAKVTGFLAEQISLSDQVVKFISGVDPAIERERSRKSNELAAKLGAAQQDITVSGTLKDDNARAIKDAEDLAASVGKFDPSQFGKDLRKSFNPDDLKAKLEDLRRTARTKVENPITEGVGKAVEAVKAVAFEGFGDVISEGQSKFKSQGSFVGAAAGQQGSSTASKMFDLQKQQLAFEKKKEEKQKQRDDKLHAAVVKNSNIKPVRV